MTAVESLEKSRRPEIFTSLANKVVDVYKRQVADMPFGTVHGDPQVALAAAVRMMKESGVDAVKVEGGHQVADSLKTVSYTHLTLPLGCSKG